MITAILISCGAVAAMLALALTERRLHPGHPSLRIFWLAPLIGALVFGYTYLFLFYVAD